MKKANGIVLDKPGKPSYDSPASFRVIVLLQTVSKILERVVASRLSLTARTLKLVHSNQCGSLPALSSFDAAISLVDTVRTLQRPGLKVSTLFLDIEDGFDNVNASILCSSLKKAGVPHYMVSWIGSFLSQRTCRLLFQGSLKTFSPVQVGTPQGSPISALPFVIYVATLHIQIARGLSLSYVDDFALSATSTSYRTNIRTLQRAFGRIRARASAREVGFSVPKTEHIQGRTPLQRDPPASPAPDMPGWPGILPSPLGQVARVLVHTQPGIVGTLLQETWTGPRGLCHCQKTLTAWLGPLPPSRTSPSDIPVPLYPAVWCRPYAPQEGNAHEDGRLLVPSPTLGFELLQIKPNSCPSSGSLHSSSVGHCPAQATYDCPQTSLRRPHSHPCSRPSLPNLPLPTQV